MNRAFLCLLWLTIASVHAGEPKHTYVPPAGYVPDAATAIKIAVAVWEPIYGARTIAGEKPYKATLAGDIWTVTGSMPAISRLIPAPGGVAEADISKQDGRILRVSHGL